MTATRVVDPKTYTVSATAGTGGTISPTSRSVAQGSSTTFTVTPQTGHVINSVTGCAGTLSGSTYTTGAVAAACNVSASFKPITHTVSASAGAGGSISPTSRSVNQGSSTTFTVTPQTGHVINSVTGCAGTLSGSTYTTGAIAAACTVSASFRPITHTVSTSAGAGGSISPTSRSVNQGSATTFTVTPNAGYKIVSATGCNGKLTGNTYNIGPITAACSVSASFSRITHTVAATAGTGGSISPTSRSVAQGSTTTFTVTPQAGYQVANVTGCSGSRSGNTYTTGTITAACSVSASFENSTPTWAAISNQAPAEWSVGSYNYSPYDINIGAIGSTAGAG
uniref:InlB B-repeat-containing protein n=1 Tax=Rheinheimera sp. TaxID=1869214 RepID=UPI0040481C77